MSQIDPGNGGYDFSHYENDNGLLKENAPSIGQQRIGRKQPAEHKKPPELVHARPAKNGSTGWSAGRMAACIFTAGISELLRMAWRGIMSCCSLSRPAPDPEPRVKIRSADTSAARTLPSSDPNVDKENAPVVQGILGNAELPGAHKAAVDSLLEDLRGKYGSKYVPEGMCLNALLKTIPRKIYADTAYDFLSAVKDAKHAVSPRELQDLIRSHFQQHLNMVVLADMTKAAAEEAGGLGGLDATDIVKSRMKTPDAEQRLKTCTCPADVQAVFRDMGLDKLISAYRSALFSAVHELQGIYGKEVFPDDLNALMQTKNAYDNDTLLNKLGSRLRNDSAPISAGGLKEIAMHYLLPAALHGFVRKAVEQAALEMGVPVTERSVCALASAIISDKGNKAELSIIKDPEALVQAVAKMVRSVMPAQKDAAGKIYAELADQLKPELRPLLYTYITGLSFAPSDAEASGEAARRVARHLKNWENFSGNEKEMQGVNEAFRRSYGEDLKHLETDKDNQTGYVNDIYETLLHDANRSDFTINGVEIGKENAAGELTGQLKSALPNGRDQRFISKLINQRLQADLMMLVRTGMLPDGRMSQDVPGSGVIAKAPPGQFDFLHDIDVTSSYNVTVAPDKKTAVVTATMTLGMHYLDNKTFGGAVPDFGAVRHTFSFTLNLSAHEKGQGVVSFTLGQQFLPLDKVRA